MATAPRPALFSTGRVLATPAALIVLNAASITPDSLITRHVTGDWGELSIEDVDANQDALQHGWRLLSSFNVGERKVWVITEADRSITTLLLPSEY